MSIGRGSTISRAAAWLAATEVLPASTTRAISTKSRRSTLEGANRSSRTPLALRNRGGQAVRVLSARRTPILTVGAFLGGNTANLGVGSADTSLQDPNVVSVWYHEPNAQNYSELISTDFHLAVFC